MASLHGTPMSSTPIYLFKRTAMLSVFFVFRMLGLNVETIG